MFGVGVGYVKREFDVMSIPYEERGARVDEHIAAIKTLWTEDQPFFEGQFHKISGVQAKPLPLQNPHPPIIIGGMSTPAYRRAVTLGDGWYGFNLNEAQTATALAGLRSAAERAGNARRAERLEISITPSGPMTAERVQAFEELGVHRLILLPRPDPSASTLLDGTRAFIEASAEAFIR